jgi:hypothetical protein
MWIASQHGFYSIVRKEAEAYHVRARRREDLENLLALAGVEAEVLDWDRADYRYRVIVDLETLLEILVRLGTDLDYPNFKARIYEREEQSHKLGAYHRIWEAMAGLRG